MSRFAPSSAGPQPVLVQMTRPLYGQLVAQRFYAPKPFERADWFKGTTEGSAEHRRRDVGLKIVRQQLRIAADGAGLRLRDAVSGDQVEIALVNGRPTR